MEKLILLVTGASGQLGQELKQLSKRFIQYQFLFTDVDTLDITQAEAVNQYFTDHAIDVCINCAAYTAVDKAEENEALANAVNIDGARNLAQACASHGALMVHFSTDYICSPEQPLPIKETDTPKPTNKYSMSKWLGEEAIRNAHSRHVVLRTSWLYSTYGQNFVKTMLRLAKERDQLGVVYDQVGTPTYARDVAICLFIMIERIGDEPENTELLGTFNLSNEGVCSWYDLAAALFTLTKTTIELKPIRTEQYPLPAKRPAYSVLDKTKIGATYGIVMPHWLKSLKDCLKRMKK